jgi:hypothetical protein
MIHHPFSVKCTSAAKLGTHNFRFARYPPIIYSGLLQGFPVCQAVLAGWLHLRLIRTSLNSLTEIAGSLLEQYFENGRGIEDEDASQPREGTPIASPFCREKMKRGDNGPWYTQRLTEHFDRPT